MSHQPQQNSPLVRISPSVDLPLSLQAPKAVEAQQESLKAVWNSRQILSKRRQLRVWIESELRPLRSDPQHGWSFSSRSTLQSLVEASWASQVSPMPLAGRAAAWSFGTRAAAPSVERSAAVVWPGHVVVLVVVTFELAKMQSRVEST